MTRLTFVHCPRRALVLTIRRESAEKGSLEMTVRPASTSARYRADENLSREANAGPEVSANQVPAQLAAAQPVRVHDRVKRKVTLEECPVPAALEPGHGRKQMRRDHGTDESPGRTAPNKGICIEFTKGNCTPGDVIRVTTSVIARHGSTAAGGWACVTEMRAVGVEPDRGVYNAIVSACVRAGNFPEAMRALAIMMCDPQLTPDKKTLNTLIQGFIGKGDLASAKQLVQVAENLEVKLDFHRAANGGVCRAFLAGEDGVGEVDVLRVTTSCLKRVQTVVAGWECVNEMIVSGVAPDTPVCNSLIALLVRCGDDSGAESVLELMKGYQVALDAGTFAPLIRSCVGRGDVERAKGYVDAMGRAGVAPDVRTASALMEVFMKARRPGEAEEVLAAFIERGGQPDAGLYCVLISGYMDLREFERIPAHFRSMCEIPGFQSDDVVASLLVAWCKAAKDLWPADEFLGRVRAAGGRLLTSEVRVLLHLSDGDAPRMRAYLQHGVEDGAIRESLGFIDDFWNPRLNLHLSRIFTELDHDTGGVSLLLAEVIFGIQNELGRIVPGVEIVVGLPGGDRAKSLGGTIGNCLTAAGFRWKPNPSNPGRLVVLLPQTAEARPLDAPNDRVCALFEADDPKTGCREVWKETERLMRSGNFEQGVQCLARLRAAGLPPNPRFFVAWLEGCVALRNGVPMAKDIAFGDAAAILDLMVRGGVQRNAEVYTRMVEICDPWDAGKAWAFTLRMLEDGLRPDAAFAHAMSSVGILETDLWNAVRAYDAPSADKRTAFFHNVFESTRDLGALQDVTRQMKLARVGDYPGIHDGF